VDAAGALADLTEISSQVERAVVLDADGGVLASTFVSDEAAEALARPARELLAEAGRLSIGAGRELTQLEVALRDGSVFVAGDGTRTVAATTAASPTSALVLYDLRACLRAIAESEVSKPSKPRRRARNTVDA
jgi:predicted regulator of Ras-like GTPase activity (Roadblock/LC7/MglB family)